MPAVGLSPLGTSSFQNVTGRSTMELRGWHHSYQRNHCFGTLSLLPPLSDFISCVYSQLLRLLTGIPCNSLNKRVVVHFAYKDITVEVDLGDVKAAGVVCILGLGAGLGTLVIYRLYHHYIRPFLDLKQRDPDSDNNSSSSAAESNAESDCSDSGVDGAMGNNSSGPTPAVYYSPQYGVALGRRTRPPKEQEEIDRLRFRHTGASQRPAHRVEGGSDSGGGSSPRSPNLASPPYEVNVKESFYSTAESGFETLPEVTEEDEDESGDELSLSLRENLSVSSLKERNDRYFASLKSSGNVSASGDNNNDDSNAGLNQRDDVTGEEQNVPVLRTEPASSSDKSSSLHSGERVPDTNLLLVHRKTNTNNHNHHHHNNNTSSTLSHSEDYEEDPSLEVSESLRSLNSSGEEEWSWEDEDKDTSPFTYTPSQQAMTDSQFRQSLMQRIREWSTFAEDYGKAPSPTQSPMPDFSAALSSSARIGRSQSLDQRLSEVASVPDVVDLTPAETPSGQDDSTIKSLETLETEFHDIQGEFESITSKLHELIEKGGADQESQSQSPQKGGDPKSQSQSQSPHKPPTKSGQGEEQKSSSGAANLQKKKASTNQEEESGKKSSGVPKLEKASAVEEDSERKANNSRSSPPGAHKVSLHRSYPGGSSSSRRGLLTSSPHHHSQHQRPPRTKWERMPSAVRSDSSCSSRASSVDYSWDCGAEVGAGAGSSPLLHRLPPHPPALTEELSGEDGAVKVTSIGKAVPIVDYAAHEWKGDTPKAQTIRQGYQAIPELFGCHQVRQVRGDNYCGLRSTLFQVLVCGHKVMHRWPGLLNVVERLHELNADPSSGLQHWTFGHRLQWQGEEERFSLIAQCVLSLYVMIEEISALPTEEERLTRTLSLMNGSERFDTELMEGLKLMMLFGARDLQRSMAQEGSEVPTFAWLLFARDTSEDVVGLVRNHLNCVGDSAGIDQVEMCLLGHCLGVRLRVARLDHQGQQDFHCVFPDEAPHDWPSVCLIAEDDRHYNVPVV